MTVSKNYYWNAVQGLKAFDSDFSNCNRALSVARCQHWSRIKPVAFDSCLLEPIFYRGLVSQSNVVFTSDGA